MFFFRLEHFKICSSSPNKMYYAGAPRIFIQNTCFVIFSTTVIRDMIGHQLQTSRGPPAQSPLKTYM